MGSRLDDPLRDVAAHFQLTYTLEWTTTGRSVAYLADGHLRINEHAILGLPWVCYHELAHLLAEQRHPGQGHRHGPLFRTALCDVIVAAGHPLHAYPWHWEYPRIRAWAQRVFTSPL